MWQTYVIAALIVAACVAVAVKGIVNKKKGKRSCSCGCSCASCGMGCHAAAAKKHKE